MANRPRLDEETAAAIAEFIDERLLDAGLLTNAEVRHAAKVIDRSTRHVRRLIGIRREALGLASPPACRSVPDDLSSVEAFVAGFPFRFDADMRTIAQAYAGNLAALHRAALDMSDDPDAVISYEHLARKFRREVGNDMRALIRKGIKGFKSASLYVRWSAKERNEVWQIDATELDIWIKPQGSEERVRPWLLLIIDDYSRVILASTLMLHEYNASDSASAVHCAIRTRDVTLPDGQVTTLGGVPGKILCDNALQFTGQVLTEVAQKLSFIMWAVAVYMGEKKGKVERAIRDVNEQLCAQLPGYANPGRKTLTARDQLRGAVEDALDEVDFLDELSKWVEWKNNQAHPTQRSKSRYEVWAECPGQLRLVADEMLTEATVAVSSHDYVFHKDGFGVQRHGHTTHYVHEDLVGCVGDRFHLRELPGETSWVDAYTLDGKFVARCVDASLLSADQVRSYDHARFARYKTIASERSGAVELRAVAAADPGDDQPSPLAVAHARANASPSPDLVRQSLGLPSAGEHAGDDTADDDTVDVDGEEVDLDAAAPELAAAPAPAAVDLDALAASAVTLDDGATGAQPVELHPAEPAPKAKKKASTKRVPKKDDNDAAKREVA